MKLTRFSFLVIGLLSFGALVKATQAQSSPPAGNPASGAALTPNAEPPDRQELSIAVGNFFARYDTNYFAGNFAMDARTDLDMGKVIEGFTNFLTGSDTTMPWAQVTNLLNRQVLYLRDKAMQESNAMVAAGPETKAKGIKFLDDNAALPGVKRLTNGVEYKVVAEGDGVIPSANDIVTLSLVAKLIDGTEVGTMSNREMQLSNERILPPALVPVLSLMKAGSHCTIYLPYDLAYGDKPAMGSALRAPKVPPYSVMIFDINLESVRQGPPSAPATMPMPMPAPTPMPMPASSVPAGSTTPNNMPVAHVPPSQPIFQTSSDIVRVPSADELKRGSNIETMTLDEAIKRSKTNPSAGQ